MFDPDFRKVMSYVKPYRSGNIKGCHFKLLFHLCTTWSLTLMKEHNCLPGLWQKSLHNAHVVTASHCAVTSIWPVFVLHGN